MILEQIQWVDFENCDEAESGLCLRRCAVIEQAGPDAGLTHTRRLSRGFECNTRYI